MEEALDEELTEMLFTGGEAEEDSPGGEDDKKLEVEREAEHENEVEDDFRER